MKGSVGGEIGQVRNHQRCGCFPSERAGSIDVGREPARTDPCGDIAHDSHLVQDADDAKKGGVHPLWNNFLVLLALQRRESRLLIPIPVIFGKDDLVPWLTNALEWRVVKEDHIGLVESKVVQAVAGIERERGEEVLGENTEILDGLNLLA